VSRKSKEIQMAEDRRLGERFDLALKMAHDYHGDQKRKGAETPYFGHILGVASLVIDEGGTEDEVIAALLHDAPEDQGGEATLEEIRVAFGDRVADIVERLSDTFDDPKPAWKERKENYLDHLRTEDDRSVLLVSIADKLHNARSIVLDRDEHGEEVWERFTGRKDGSLWYYGELATIFEKNFPGALSEEFSRTVARLSAGPAPG
jgi:(p)ppGpp synthase/HD superfamily hydrolase